MKKQFQTPMIYPEVRLETGACILAGSVVDTMTVNTMGQEVEEYDFSSPSSDFDVTWE